LRYPEKPIASSNRGEGSISNDLIVNLCHFEALTVLLSAYILVHGSRGGE
jgi:hypothetical protein